jgi:hypothetical protein
LRVQLTRPPVTNAILFRLPFPIVPFLRHVPARITSNCASSHNPHHPATRNVDTISKHGSPCGEIEELEEHRGKMGYGGRIDIFISDERCVC